MLAVAAVPSKEELLKRPVIKRPYLKAVRITGEPVEHGDRILAPALGVPYGCKFWSPVVLYTTWDDHAWHLLSIVALAEDYGHPFGEFSLSTSDGLVLALMRTYPLGTFCASLSQDGGETWTHPVEVNPPALNFSRTAPAMAV